MDPSMPLLSQTRCSSQVSNLAQASALLASSFLSSPLYGYAEASDANGSSSSPKVNWVGASLHFTYLSHFPCLDCRERCTWAVS